MAYSFIGFQTAYMTTRWNPVYWNTACLIVNSGSLEDNSTEEIVDIYAPEAQDLAEGTTFEDLPDRSGKIKRTSSTDYAKLAKAIGDIRSHGIAVSPVDINESKYSFEPDAVNNRIRFGLKGLNKVGEPVIEKIIEGRPYTSIVDFMNRCPLNKTAMISLIKAGAFDNVDSKWASKYGAVRKVIMVYYISKICEPKTKLNLQNFNGLLQKDLIPDSLDLEKRVFNFNSCLKKYQKFGRYFFLDTPFEAFYSEYFDISKIDIIEGRPCILQNVWDKMYQSVMNTVRDYIKNNQEEILKKYNYILFKEYWDKYALGNISSWEMESMCFYYHEHELINVNRDKYGIVNFFKLSPDADIDYILTRGGRELPIYKTYKIIGTVISKNDTRSSISLLTPDGVVPVKMTREYYAMFAKQISEVQEDGTKKVMEKGWFTRGTKLMCVGFRRDDTFNCKTYKHTNSHQLYKIVNLNKDNTLNLTHNRYGEIDD